MGAILERAAFAALFEARGLTVPDALYDRFEAYAAMLTDYNTRVNLTAITDPHGISVRHFLDSLLPLTLAPPPEGAALVDVGAGAGFPSVPMKLWRPDLRLTLLDSLNKRVLFLRALTAELGIEADCLHVRAEDAGRSPALRERFDVATARAVAALPVLAEYCLPLVKVGGLFMALKGPNPSGEVSEAAPAIRKLGGAVERVLDYSLEDGEGRALVLVRKISQTPTQFPRPSAKITKSPL